MNKPKFVASLALTAVLLGSIPFPSFAAKNEEIKVNNLTYEQVITELENTKKGIETVKDMNDSEKENIRIQSYEVVNEFLDFNKDLDASETDILLTSLEDIDALLYDVATEKGNVNFGSKSIDYSKSVKDVNEQQAQAQAQPLAITGWSGKGDILISLVAKTNGFPHGHAAILSTTKNYVVEALPKPGVVHQSASKYWSTVSDEGQYYVKGAPDSAYIKAVDYAKKQIGDPYKLKTTLNDTSQWYCSKLVFKAWQDAGYHVGSLDAALGLVLPASIRADLDTVKYKSNPY